METMVYTSRSRLRKEEKEIKRIIAYCAVRIVGKKDEFPKWPKKSQLSPDVMLCNDIYVLIQGNALVIKGFEHHSNTTTSVEEGDNIIHSTPVLAARKKLGI